MLLGTANASSQRDNSTTEIMLAKALTAEENGNIPAAIDLHKKILELQPSNVRSMNSIAGLYGQTSEFNEEILWAKKAIKTDPNFGDAYINYGNALAQLGKIFEANSAFKTAAKLTPKSPIAFYSIGLLAERTKNISKAIVYYRKSITVDPTFENGYFNLATVLANVGRYDEAISLLKKLLALNPGDREARAMMRDIERSRKN